MKTMTYRNYRILIVILWGMVISGCEMLEKHQMMLASNPVPQTAQSIERGQAIFSQYCVACHGESAQGDGPAAKSLAKKPADLTQLDKRSGVIAMRIYYGADPMPAWRHQLSKKEIWDVVNYIQHVAEN